LKRIFPSLATLLLLMAFASSAHAQEVVIMSGPEQVVTWLESENWWGLEKRDSQLEVPRTIILGISQRWREQAPNLPVETKKEIFYRFMLPLVVHANTMVLDRRQRLQRLDDTLAKGQKLSGEDDAWLRGLAVVLRITDQSKIDQLTKPMISDRSSNRRCIDWM